MRVFYAIRALACVVIVVAAGAYSLPVQAQMYRCKSTSGAAVVQDTPCASNSSEASASGLDVLDPRQCAWWSYTISLASNRASCVLIFQATDEGYTVDNAHISLGGRPVTLHLFDSNILETEVLPGVSVAESERYSYASADKVVQVYVRAALSPQRCGREVNEREFCGERLQYRGKLNLKTAAGEKTMSIAYDRPYGASRQSSGRNRAALKRGR